MTAGRPPAYETKEELEKAIEAYFSSDDAYITIGEESVFAPGIAGLAYHLGVSTETLRRYGEDDKFCATIKHAKQRIEMSLEKRLHCTAVTGTIFNLKNNFGWKDKQEQEISGPNGGPQEHKWTIEVVDASNADT